jgi:dihydrolipoamide dehydrogenase
MNDILIIGAGPGGFELALEAAKYGLTSTLFEARHLGGTCLNEGCIPTKTYYKNAGFLRELAKAETLGVTIGNHVFDFAKAQARKEQIVADLQKGIDFQLKKANVQEVEGFARMVDKNTVRCNDILYQGRYIVIATGSRPYILPGFEKAMDSTGILNLEVLPKHLVIIGGGVIGIEMATIFKTFGCEVEVVEYADRIVSTADKEISKRLLAYLKSQGITFYLNTKALSFDGSKVDIETKDGLKSLPCDQCLVSVGRRPNIENIGLDDVRVKYTPKGIITDDYFKTSIDNIFAIGDVAGKQMLAHYATYSGYQVLNDILLEKGKINFNLVPSCVFTFPEVAWVGLTEEEAQKHPVYKTYKSLYRSNGKALSLDETDGFVKIITIGNQIKGVHIIGHEASNLIHEMSSLMNMGITKERFLDFIHAHPTLSELFNSALK